MSTFSTYEIMCEKREGGVRKNVENLIVLLKAVILSFKRNVDSLIKRGREGVKKV